MLIFLRLKKIILNFVLPTWKIAKIIVGFGVPEGAGVGVYEIIDLIDESKNIDFDNGGDEFDLESGYDFAVGGLLKNKYIYILDSEEIIHPWTDAEIESLNQFLDSDEEYDEGPR